MIRILALILALAATGCIDDADALGERRDHIVQEVDGQRVVDTRVTGYSYRHTTGPVGDGRRAQIQVKFNSQVLGWLRFVDEERPNSDEGGIIRCYFRPSEYDSIVSTLRTEPNIFLGLRPGNRCFLGPAFDVVID